MGFALTPLHKKFILHWGEIGTRWGINRTVAEVHALLYLSPSPLNAEDIASALSISRSNVSGSLRELLGWGLIRNVHVLGDRRDHFEAEKDVWEVFLRILEERKRREIDPAVAVLRASIEKGRQPGVADAEVRRHLEEMLQFCELMESWYAWLRGVPRQRLIRLIKMGSKLQGLLSLWAGNKSGEGFPTRGLRLRSRIRESGGSR